MIPVKQTLFGGDFLNKETLGNCYPACIATILGIPLGEVPHFFQLETDEIPALDIILPWFHGRGLTSVCFDWSPWIPKYYEGIITIIGGKSPRGGWSHAVVGRITKEGYELLHDPHPSNSGIVGEPTAAEFIHPLNYWN